MKSWHVIFGANGSIRSVVPLEGERGTDWVIVEAVDEPSAKRAAYNLYCTRKKTLAKGRLRAEGKCCCGRKQDRKHPDGRTMLTCSVCAERRPVWQANYDQRKADGTIGSGVAERDEAGRVAANLERQRDRKAEMRLEVLVEVRARWMGSRNVGVFSQWLVSEIASLTELRTGAPVVQIAKRA